MKTTTMIKSLTFSAALAVAAPGYATDWNAFNCGDGWGPIKAEAPSYPLRARQKGIEGSIIMSFNVTPNGEVTDIRVAESTGTAFIRSATRAVESYQFPPCVSEGLARPVENVSVKYDFNLEG